MVTTESDHKKAGGKYAEWGMTPTFETKLLMVLLWEINPAIN